MTVLAISPLADIAAKILDTSSSISFTLPA